MPTFEDITKTGPQTYKDLQEENSLDTTPAPQEISPEVSRYLQTQVALNPLSEYDPNNLTTQMVQSSLGTSKTPWGKSMFDDEYALENDFQHLGNVRAENEPWYAKIASGFAKGVITAGTTLVDGTLGLLYGASTAIQEERISGFWDNPFSKAMQSIKDWSEEAFPNYYSEAEENDPWFKNIFTANFLGDKFIKNFGFTIGAFYPGMWATDAIRAARLPNLIGKITRSANAPAITSAVTGSFVSAVNEGRIEAIENTRDNYEYTKNILEDQRMQDIQGVEKDIRREYADILDEYEIDKNQNVIMVRTPDGNMTTQDAAYVRMQEKLSDLDTKRTRLLQQVDKSYDDAMARLAEDRRKEGNVIWALNIGLLTTTNLIEFGHAYEGGYRTARKNSNILKDPITGLYSLNKRKIRGNVIGAALTNPHTEGTEEVLQQLAANIAGDYYSQDAIDFYKAKKDGASSEQTMDWLKATTTGLIQTLTDGNTWEQYVLGFMTGAVGVPRFRSFRNAQGQRQAPVTIEGGIVGGVRDYREIRDRENQIIDNLNERVSSPDFLTYYQGLIRNRKYQNDMDDATMVGDEKAYKDAEHAQLISDIIVFDEAGKLDDLITLIQQSSDMSEEDIEAIINDTRTENEDGSWSGPFIDTNGNSLPIEQVREKLQKTKEELLKETEHYRAIKDDLNILTGRIFDDEQLAHLTWMVSTIDNKSARVNDMSGEIQQALIPIIQNLAAYVSTQENELREEGAANAELTDRYKTIDKRIQDANKILSLFRQATSVSAEQFGTVLLKQKGFTQSLSDIFKNSSDEELSFKAGQREDTIKKLSDILALNKDIESYNNTLKEYLAHPGNLQRDMNQADEEIVQEEAINQAQSAEDRLSSAQTIQEFSNTYQQIEQEDPTLARELLETLINDENNTLAREYRERAIYKEAVEKIILSDPDTSPQEFNDAMTLLNSLDSSAPSFDILADPDSLLIDFAALPTDARERLQNAEFTLKKAMTQANMDNKFKQWFSAPLDALQEALISRPREGGGIDFFTVRQGKRINKKVGGLPISLTQEEKTTAAIPDNATDIRAYSYVGTNEQGQHMYEISYKIPDNRGRINTQIAIDRMLHSVPMAVTETTGSDAVPKGPYVNLQGVKTTTQEQNTGGDAGNPISEKQTINENDKITQTIFSDEEGTTSILAQGEQRTFYMPVISKFLPEAVRLKRDFTPFDEAMKEKTGGKKDYSLIYKYFKDNNTFIFLDLVGITGGLKVGSRIGFMIDPIYESSKQNSETYTGDKSKPTIFMVLQDESSPYDKHVVGSLPEEEDAIAGYVGLGAVINRIRQEYAASDESKSTDKKFYSQAVPAVKVARMMIGRVPFSDQEKDLKEILASTIIGDVAPVLAVMKNNRLDTNGAIDSENIIMPNDRTNGRVYMLIPSPSGRYYPVVIRRKHFNANEFNLYTKEGAVDVAGNTILGIKIREALEDITNAAMNDDLEGLGMAVKKLKSLVYLQDVDIYPSTNNRGTSLRFVKKERDSEGNLIQDNEGHYKTTTTYVSITHLHTDNNNGTLSSTITEESFNNILQNILTQLYSYNAPIQVDSYEINNNTFEGNTNYNDMLIQSGILSSNLQRAAVEGNWFITDYIDENNKPQKAIPNNFFNRKTVKDDNSSSNDENTKPTIPGTRIQPVSSTISTVLKKLGITDNTIFVDTENNVIRDSQGKAIYFPPSTQTTQELLFDLSAAMEAYGVQTDIPGVMIDGKVLSTRTGKVIDIPHQRYLNERETAKFIKDLKASIPTTIEDNLSSKSSTQTPLEKAQQIINTILKNQEAVDRTLTTAQSYSILEEDGDYHEYQRIHTVLGENNTGVLTKKQQNTIANIRTALQKVADIQDKTKATQEWNRQIRNLQKTYVLDLSKYLNRTNNSQNRSAIIKAITNKLLHNSFNTTATINGTKIDNIVRTFFTQGEQVVRTQKPTDITQEAFEALINTLKDLQQRIQEAGETFYTNNIVLYHKYADGRRIAGEVDILAVDKEGNFKIYDLKTSRYSFYGEGFNTALDWQKRSTKEQYALQLSAYKNLFESQYDIPIAALGILPIMLTTENEQITAIQRQAGIPIEYNSLVATINDGIGVPNESGIVTENTSVTTTPTTSTGMIATGIYDTALEALKPIDHTKEQESVTARGTHLPVGYFDILDEDGIHKLHKGYLRTVGNINGLEVKMTFIPTTMNIQRTAEDGSTISLEVAADKVYVVLPNGNAIYVGVNPRQGEVLDSERYTVNNIRDIIKEQIENNFGTFNNAATEATILNTKKIENTPIIDAPITEKVIAEDTPLVQETHNNDITIDDIFGDEEEGEEAISKQDIDNNNLNSSKEERQEEKDLIQAREDNLLSGEQESEYYYLSTLEKIQDINDDIIIQGLQNMGITQEAWQTLSREQREDIIKCLKI